MSRIGGDGPNGLLVPVQRQREVPLLFHPEVPVEPFLQLQGLLLEAVGECVVLHDPRELRDPALRVVDVRLHFHERDGLLGQRSVGVDDRVVRVLPSLVVQPPRRALLVLDVAVAVPVAVPVGPVQRRLGVRAQRPHEVVVAGPAPVLRQHDQPQRCRVRGSVVRAVRLLPEPGQFAGAHLVQDPARLLVGEVVDLAPLVVGGGQQGALGQHRAVAHGLVGRDQGVPPEQAEEPGQPRGRQQDVLALRGRRDPQRHQVQGRGVPDVDDHPGVAFHLGPLRPPRHDRVGYARGRTGGVVPARRARLPWRVRERYVEMAAPQLAGSEPQVPHQVVAVHPVGGRIRVHARTGLEVAVAVAEGQPATLAVVVPDDLWRAVPYRRPDLEQVREVGTHRQPHHQPDRFGAERLELDALLEAAGDQPLPAHPDGVRAQPRQVGVGEHERRPVRVHHAGAQHQQPGAVDREHPTVQQPGVGADQTPDRTGRHVAGRVGVHERAPLRHRDRVRSQIGGHVAAVRARKAGVDGRTRQGIGRRRPVDPRPAAGRQSSLNSRARRTASRRWSAFSFR